METVEKDGCFWSVRGRAPLFWGILFTLHTSVILTTLLKQNLVALVVVFLAVGYMLLLEVVQYDHVKCMYGLGSACGISNGLYRFQEEWYCFGRAAKRLSMKGWSAIAAYCVALSMILRVAVVPRHFAYFTSQWNFEQNLTKWAWDGYQKVLCCCSKCQSKMFIKGLGSTYGNGDRLYTYWRATKRSCCHIDDFFWGLPVALVVQHCLLH